MSDGAVKECSTKKAKFKLHLNVATISKGYVRIVLAWKSVCLATDHATHDQTKNISALPKLFQVILVDRMFLRHAHSSISASRRNMYKTSKSTTVMTERS